MDNGVQSIFNISYISRTPNLTFSLKLMMGTFLLLISFAFMILMHA